MVRLVETYVHSDAPYVDFLHSGAWLLCGMLRKQLLCFSGIHFVVGDTWFKSAYPALPYPIIHKKVFWCKYNFYVFGLNDVQVPRFSVSPKCFPSAGLLKILLHCFVELLKREEFPFCFVATVYYIDL